MRAMASTEEITLREITRDTVRDILRLETTEEQRSYVAPNAVSISQAYFEPKAWFRAVYAGDRPVGFVMLLDDPEAPEYYLWRFMIAAPEQGKGYGRRALQLLVDHVRGRPGATELKTSCIPASSGGPEPFYLGFGFRPNGVVHEGEMELTLPLDPGA
jgi:diamine N-acetyltransferase